MIRDPERQSAILKGDAVSKDYKMAASGWTWLQHGLFFSYFVSNSNCGAPVSSRTVTRDLHRNCTGPAPPPEGDFYIC